MWGRKQTSSIIQPRCHLAPCYEEKKIWFEASLGLDVFLQYLMKNYET